MSKDCRPGDLLVLRHQARWRAHRRCCLTMMTSNEGFAELTRAGTPMELTAEDRAVIALPAAG
jgi:hypothetical protein